MKTQMHTSKCSAQMTYSLAADDRWFEYSDFRELLGASMPRWEREQTWARWSWRWSSYPMSHMSLYGNPVESRISTNHVDIRGYELTGDFV